MIPEVDPTGRAFAVMAFGTLACSVAERWARRIEMADARLWAWHGDQADGEALRALRAELQRARVGWRLMLTGPEADVAPAKAEAIHHGAVPTEIRTYVTPGNIRVYCPACTTTTTREAPRDEVRVLGACSSQTQRTPSPLPKTPADSAPRTRTSSRGAAHDVKCQGCDHELAIRDHFSPRLGAWLGEVKT